MAFDRVWFRPMAPCFRRQPESLARAGLRSFCMEPQRAVQFQSKSRTEWQEGLDAGAAGRYSSARVRITFPVRASWPRWPSSLSCSHTTPPARTLTLPLHRSECSRVPTAEGGLLLRPRKVRLYLIKIKSSKQRMIVVGLEIVLRTD